MMLRPSGDVINALPVVVTGGMATTTTQGNSAEDAAMAGNPVWVGGVVRTAVAPATLVAGDGARHTMLASGALTTANGAPNFVAESASSAKTATGNSGVISTAAGGAISGLLLISAVSGTSPTLDVTLEHSLDNGVTFAPIWASGRITAAQNVPIPAMQVEGIRRWVWTISGTTPSLTFAINVNQLSMRAPVIRAMFDRTIAPNTLNSASAALNIEGCQQISAIVVNGAGATVNPTYVIDVSMDGANWGPIPTSGNPVPPSSTVVSAALPVSARWARLRIYAAGTGATQTYAALHATG
jgi:hypothetical protein